MMFSIYFPIAELSMNVLALLSLGVVVGILSGLFGIGGGFLSTPILIFMGVPPSITVGSQANQMVGASTSAIIAHWKRGHVDLKLGLFLLTGGWIGSSFGVWVFSTLHDSGQVDWVISVSYVVVLCTIGTIMGIDSIKIWINRSNKQTQRSTMPGWIQAVPWHIDFPKSGIRVSWVVPCIIGAFAGFLAALLGIGGGFVLTPALIYLLGVSTHLVVGTTLFQVIFITGNIALLQAVVNQTVDIVLALVLIFGGVVGAQIGSRWGLRINALQLKGFMAMIILGVAALMLMELVMPPHSPFTLDRAQ